MNGSKSKALRKLANHNLKMYRKLTPNSKYRIEEHIKFKQLPKEEGKERQSIKFVSLQLWCKGNKVLYKSYKKHYKRGRGDYAIR